MTPSGRVSRGARFAYFYLMGTDEEGIRESVPAHIAHWRLLGLDDYTGGPFDDRSGGLITFRSDEGRQAEQAVATDPFVELGLLEEYWLKRWKPD